MGIVSDMYTIILGQYYVKKVKTLLHTILTSGGATDTTRCGMYEASGMTGLIMLSRKDAGIDKIEFVVLPAKRLYVLLANVLDFGSIVATLRRQASNFEQPN